ncbi:DUF4241 domain-containing protein [Streptomyces sp. ET3-23]|uniref:DUF4241 domain-containing protein n=1 Tax=Streptomyces sp. ET3-23 TaxID=2885643 RepID=UPI001D12B6C9|nr:DUF4241 domain-containing protein [Streptomyces sp. ET3-23]MCC2280951.1 DUF4241 domain-containing protein [Streptomyces sp. ET3-23]
MSASAVEVMYGEGWCARSRAVIGPMTEEEALRRHVAGDPYAVLLRVAGRPLAELRITGRAGYVGLLLFDVHGRRHREYDYVELRRGLLHLRRHRQWLYRGPDEAERPEPAVHFTLNIKPDGRARRRLEHHGMFETIAHIPEEHRTLLLADFGGWTRYADAGLLGLPGPITLVPAPVPEAAGSPDGSPLWSAPAPRAPGELEALFVPGSRFESYDGPVTVVEPEEAGILRLPTGRVIVADPTSLSADDEPFTAMVPPGTYPLVLGKVERRGERHGEELAWEEITAAMLRIGDRRPTIAWEQALLPGQEIRLLGEGEYYGFGVDSGTAAFLDLAARDALAADPDAAMDLAESIGDEVTCPQFHDPVSGANAIAFPSGAGDGSYPVWIGRDCDGEVTCLIADMHTVDSTRPLPPTPVSPTVVRLPPVPPAEGPLPNPAPHAETAHLFAQLLLQTVTMARRPLPGQG